MPELGFDDPATERQYWVTQLMGEGAHAKHSTMQQVRKLRPVGELMRLLHDADEDTRAVASNMLWTIWLAEGGKVVEKLLLRGMELILEGAYDEAATQFTAIIRHDAGFAEAYNKRATAHYLAGDFERAIADCEETLKRNENHFGAWHGLGLGHEALGNYREAVWAFRRALQLNPFTKENRRRLQACLDRLALEPDA